MNKKIVQFKFKVPRCDICLKDVGTQDTLSGEGCCYIVYPPGKERQYTFNLCSDKCLERLEFVINKMFELFECDTEYIGK